MSVAYDLKMVRGDTLEFILEVRGNTSNVSSIIMSCRKSNLDTSYVFQKTMSNGISLIETGKYAIRVSPSDTSSKTPGNYVYDVQITMGNDVYTPLYGRLIMLPDVTYS